MEHVRQLIPSHVSVEHGHSGLSHMFKWNIDTSRTPADVQVEHSHLPESFKYAYGTKTPADSPQMFKWNMYAGQIPSDVQAEHLHLTDPSNVPMEH